MTTNTKINPLIHIWFHPKKTMRHILDHYPKRFVHLLAILGAATHVTMQASYSWNNDLWLTVLIWVVLSVVLGLVILYGFGALIKWSGSWLGGKARYDQVVSVVGWSQLPVIGFFLVELAVFFIVGQNSISLFYTSINYVFYIWSFIIFIGMLSEANQFTFFRALINTILALIMFVVIMFIIGNVADWIVSHIAYANQ